QIIQEAQFIQAAVASFYGRGNRSVSLAFSVTRTFDTVNACELFVHGHYGAVEDEGTLLCRCGARGEDATDVLYQAAVLVGPRIAKYRGVSVQIDYQFRAPQVTSVFVSEIASEGDIVRSASIAIPEGVDHWTAEGLALPAIPVRIFPHVRIPAGGDTNITAHVVDGTITADGFDCALSGVVGAGYLLDFFYQL